VASARAWLWEAYAERFQFILPCEFAICSFMSNCRGKSDLGLCTTSVLAKRMRLRNGDFQLMFQFVLRSGHCVVAFFLQVSKLCTALDLTLLYMLILGNMKHFRMEKRNASARRLLSAVMLECWPHICRVKITFGLLLTNCFVSTTTNLMKCFVNWIPLRIRVGSSNTQPYLNRLVFPRPQPANLL